MVDDFQVIIPWFPKLATEKRNRALSKVLDLYAQAGIATRLAVCPSDSFVKALAVTPALWLTSASLVAVADADVWCDGLGLAVEAIREGRAVWGRPHTEVFRLKEQATNQFYETGVLDLTNLARKPYIGIDGGGITIGKPSDFLKVPLDPRFKGWGGEDSAWGYALHTLLGPPYLGPYSLIHFWHEPMEKINWNTGNLKNEALRKRYVACIGRPERMSRLIGEIDIAEETRAE